MKIPARIERDPMFTVWNDQVPRLWYHTQRQASRLDAETLYGSLRFAKAYVIPAYEALGVLLHTGVVALRTWLRTGEESLSLSHSGTRIAHYIRRGTETLSLSHTGYVSVPAGPVAPVVHPIPPDRD